MREKLLYVTILPTMAINVEVERNPNENNLTLLRRFTKRVQGSGILPRVRGIRYELREPSFYKKKRKTLNRLKRKVANEKLVFFLFFQLVFLKT